MIDDVEIQGFDWDEGNRAKCEQHGMSLDEVEQVFAGLLLRVDDPAHSQVEARWQAIGRTREGRLAFVAFTLRRRDGSTLLRPISARYMHRQEIERYERQAPARPDQ